MLYKSTLSCFRQQFPIKNINQFCNNKDTDKIIQDYELKIMLAREIPNTQERTQQLNKLKIKFTEKLKQIKKEQDLSKVKQFITEGMDNNKRSAQSLKKSEVENQSYMPNNLFVKKLKYGKKKILFLGIDQEDQDHCIYLKRMSEKLKIKTAITALPPDMPYFIKTQNTFMDQWRKFLQIPGYAKLNAKFYLNPIARTIQDVQLKKQQIQLVRNSLNKSKQFSEIMYAVMQYNSKMRRYLPNGLLTPFLINNINSIYFADFPVLKERQMWAMTVPLVKMRQLFQIYKLQQKKQQSFFDPRIMLPKTQLIHKFQHMINIIKLASYQNNSNQDTPMLFVCPSEYSQLFCQQWKKQKQLLHFFDLQPYKTRSQKTKPVSFIQFVQKLVIMDTILEPIINKYYIKYQSFPYKASQTFGGKQHVGKIFILWKHFQGVYKEALLKR